MSVENIAQYGISMVRYFYKIWVLNMVLIFCPELVCMSNQSIEVKVGDGFYLGSTQESFVITERQGH